jgi:hypothetical protein
LQRTPKNFVVLDNQNANAHRPLSRHVTHSDGASQSCSYLGWQVRQGGCRNHDEAKGLIL